MPVYMERENQTGMAQFYFHPFTSLPEMRLLIFWAFLILYLLSIFGNAAIVIIVYIAHSLHTPMYFFLANLAVLEIAYSCAIAPLTLANLARKVSISLAGCGTQLFFFTFLGGADCVLLAIMAILRIRSAAGRKRAFSTCSSHLMVVLLQYGCSSLIYLRPSSSYSLEEGRVISVFYTFITPVLNPLIYSMRNKELKDALNRALTRKVVSQRK